ncbi:MAG: TMEM43 family protein, partial [Rhizobiaceae bacterium]
MAVTEVTHTSWFSRIGSSVVGSLIGLALVVGMAGLLFWNEGRAVKTAKALAEGAGSVVEVSANAVDAANEGRLVHIAAAAAPVGVPEDSRLGIKAEGAVSLERAVEMFQWRETQKSETRTKVGGGQETVTTYDYERAWSSSPISSSGFKEPAGHQNPPMPIQGDDFAVPTVNVGAFAIAGGRVTNLASDSAILPDAGAPDRIAAAAGISRPGKLIGDTVYFGWAADNPQIGDLRVGFKRGDLKDVSVAGAQKGNAIVDWTASNGRAIFLAKAGIVPAAELFADAVASNKALTWILRAVGLILMLVGFSLMLAILGVIGDVIPFIGSIIRSGTFLIALAMTALLGSLAIAAGWMFYRPLLSLAVVAAGVAVFYA